MTDEKAKWQQDIDTATGSTSAVAQLLNARTFELEMTVLAQAAKIEKLETRLTRLSSQLQKRISEEMRLMRRSGRLKAL